MLSTADVAVVGYLGRAGKCVRPCPRTPLGGQATGGTVGYAETVWCGHCDRAVCDCLSRQCLSLHDCLQLPAARARVSGVLFKRSCGGVYPPHPFGWETRGRGSAATDPHVHCAQPFQTAGPCPSISNHAVHRKGHAVHRAHARSHVWVGLDPLPAVSCGCVAPCWSALLR